MLGGVTNADYVQWAQDADVLARIGQALFPQGHRVTVRLPRQLAKEAAARWDRDDSGSPLPAETPVQAGTRGRAATLALIGLAVRDGGVNQGDEVVVELDAWFVGHALDAAEDEGLLELPGPPVQA
jgi:hypothetical protein